MDRINVLLYTTPTPTAFDLAEQRFVITRLVNAGILSDDVAESLRATAHVLVAVQQGLSDVEHPA